MVNSMKYYIKDKKLKLVIDELGEEYKDLLIEKLLNDYQTTDIDTLSVSELLKLDVNIKERLVQNRQIEKKRRLYYMMTSVGIMYSLLGVFLLFFQEFRYSFTNEPFNMIALIMIILGLFISMFSIIVRNSPQTQRRYTNPKDKTLFNYEIISLWKELEGLMIQLAPDISMTSSTNLIRFLVENNFISDSDENTIKSLLKLRNQAVHSNSPILDISYEESILIIKDARTIISKLNNLV